MATALKTKPGINGANVLSIPTEWDATWFRKFINNSLKGADVRNAVGANGITVTGTIASPYATISGGGPTNFTAPIVINSTAGQVSLTVNGASGQNAAVFNGPVVINDPTGVPLTLQGSDSHDILDASGTSTTVQLFTLGANAFFGTSTASLLEFFTSGTGRVLISAGGNVTVNAPASGIALQVNAAANQTGIQVSTPGSSTGASFAANGGAYLQANSSATINALAMNSIGANFGQIFNFATQVWALGYGPTVNAVGTAVLTWNATGNVVIGPQASGTGLSITSNTNQPLELITSSNAPWAMTVVRSDLGNTCHVFNNGTAGAGNGVWYFNEPITVGPTAAGALMSTNAALTTGAGAAVGTLNNAPSAGNPTKWIKINDNGTIRSVPAW